MIDDEKKMKKLKKSILFSRIIQFVSGVLIGMCAVGMISFALHNEIIKSISCFLMMVTSSIHVYVFGLYIKEDKENIDELRQRRNQ